MNNAPQRLRIAERGWNNYTGHFGGVEFKDSLSVHPVDPVTATRLGSLIKLVKVDTDEQAGQSADLQRQSDVRAEIVAELPRVDGAKVTAPAQVEQEDKPKYTREDLEKIADSEGIAGLRKIAEPMGVRGRGIVELIDEILEAQKPR